MQTDWTTPPAMARELGITPTGVRAWLQRHGLTPDDDGFWRIDAAAATAMRTYYAGRANPPIPGPCSVDGCDRPRMSPRAEMCSLHRRRLLRNGSVERREPGENQRLKTHCPHGHEYTPENTFLFNDGRRRCKTCVRKRSREGARRRRAQTPRP